MIKRFVVLAAITLAACTNATERRPEEVRPVRVMVIGETAEARVVEYAGEVRPRHEIRLSFRVGGKIVERLVEVGSTVRAGQPVARLDPADLVLAAASARAQAASLETDRNLAAADLKRYRELRDKNFISKAEFDRRLSTLEAADAKLVASHALYRQAANQAAYAVLAADSAGVITAIEVEAGQVVAPGQTVARLARRGEMEVSFAVPEAQREQIVNASGFAVTLNALPGKSWSARLRELSPMADAVTRTYAVRATILQAGENVELGMSARIAVSARSSVPRIEVPVAALYSRGDQPQVFVVDAGSMVQARPVKTAGISGERVAIESGLVAGEVIVAAGAALLRPGQRVRVLQEK
ncbi:MAG: efflux RND transporter periplasmic adaptor subunit [Betaproteobacteria bacterium]|nr:efflux RND transporter periplasmic adaptor subunit [Betaproteobacteria bacterium]